MSRLDVGQLMVDDCNCMIHEPFSGTGFQSLPKVTNPEEVWKDPKNNSQENLLGKFKKRCLDLRMHMETYAKLSKR